MKTFVKTKLKGSKTIVHCQECGKSLILKGTDPRILTISFDRCGELCEKQVCLQCYERIINLAII
jgi:uncharacterized Zn finger protein